MSHNFHKQTLPELPYDYSALEPHISGTIMELHHKKHHQGYVNTYNDTLDLYLEAADKDDLATCIALQDKLKFHGGGHVNHSLFWENLKPHSEGGGDLPAGELHDAIHSSFGSLEALIDLFNSKTVAVQGSGWGWLGYLPAKDRLMIATTSNQDPLSTRGLIPLLGVDVWEHAYYLQYKNVRGDYLKAIWNLIDWQTVLSRYQSAKSHHLAAQT